MNYKIRFLDKKTTVQLQGELSEEEEQSPLVELQDSVSRQEEEQSPVVELQDSVLDKKKNNHQLNYKVWFRKEQSTLVELQDSVSEKEQSPLVELQGSVSRQEEQEEESVSETPKEKERITSVQSSSDSEGSINIPEVIPSSEKETIALEEVSDIVSNKPLTSKLKEDITEEEFSYNIDGMSLSNPNPIFKRLHDKDPALFLTEDNGKFKQYSRACPWNVRRQPILLTDKEKEKIDKENPDSYDKALKYGSDKDNEYWYICPRYWCLLNNTPLSEEDVRQVNG